MKAVILAGGFGTRISEETHFKPKPMIEIGSRPILWHIMKHYSVHGINEFVICCGYKGYLIKEFFINYFQHMSDLTIDLSNNNIQIHKMNSEPWLVTLIDTGENTQTGGRLKRVYEYVKNETCFCFTYGDGLSDVDISQSINFHNNNNALATVTAVHPPARFGTLNLTNGMVHKFKEKPQTTDGMVNGGFFVLSPSIFEYIESDDTAWEGPPLEKLANQGQLSAFIHSGFWHPMDTLRDKLYLEDLWNKGLAPWKTWL
jgi:glucose-1-phosphate cytidylyltransferase